LHSKLEIRCAKSLFGQSSLTPKALPFGTALVTITKTPVASVASVRVMAR
jgi:hypothetical protein